MKNNTQTGSPQESQKQHNGWKLFFLILAVVLAAVGWFQLDSKPKVFKQQERRSRLEELDRKADPYFNQARKEVPKIAKKLSSKKAMMKLCWLIAKDKVTGKHQAEEYLAKHIKPVVSNCEQAAKIYGISLNSSEFTTVMKEIGADHLKASVYPLGSLGIEAVMIRSTLASVSRICGSVIARMSTCAVGGGAAAIADGPLPIGDIIGIALTVGGTAWSIYDLHQLSKQLPKDLENTLLNSIDNCRYACREVYMK